MHKTLQFSIMAFLGLILFVSACKKNEEIKPAENPFENTMATFLAEGTLSTETGTQTSMDLELGYTFKISKAGSLTQLGVRMPSAGTYKVTLWDPATGKSITQVNVTQANGSVSALTDISKLALTVDKEYIITIGVERRISYYISSAKKTESTSQTSIYPIVRGNVTILKSSYSFNLADFPDGSDSKLYGYPEFVIQFL